MSSKNMAGFTPLSWVENSIPDDGYAQKDDDQQSMVRVVEEVLSCEESLLKNKSSSYKRLRDYIRMGICPVLRPHAWKVLSGGSRVLELTPNLFTDIQDDLEYSLYSGGTLFFNASDINKYYLTPNGWKQALEVLAVLSQLHCDITFCPILQSFVCLFMHFMDKHDCFACIDSLITSKKHSLDKSGSDYCIAAKTFQDALKKWKKPAYVWLKSLFERSDANTGIKLIFCPNWLQWMFKAVDFWTMVHILDNFLLDGYKVFYRIGLVLFNEVYKHCNLTGRITNEELESVFCEVTSTFSKQPSRLLQKAFKIQGLSRQIISELRQKNVRLLSLGLLEMPEIEREASFRGPVEGSDLLTASQIQELHSALPRRLRLLCKFTCTFSSELHGTSLKTFYRKCERESYTVLLVKTADNEILGAFLTAPWTDRFKHRKSFFGSGETFLFHFIPNFKRYTWCGVKSKDSDGPAYFMLGDEKRIVIGGGDGWGLTIEEDLTHGRSDKCDTFENEPLSSGTGGEFSCLRVEVWCLEELGHLAKASGSFEKDDEQKIEFFVDEFKSETE